MKTYITHIEAIHPETGELTSFAGPNIDALTESDAQKYCNENGLGYCRVCGSISMHIPHMENSIEPDYDNAIDYDAINNN